MSPAGRPPVAAQKGNPMLFKRKRKKLPDMPDVDLSSILPAALAAVAGLGAALAGYTLGRVNRPATLTAKTAGNAKTFAQAYSSLIGAQNRAETPRISFPDFAATVFGSPQA